LIDSARAARAGERSRDAAASDSGTNRREQRKATAAARQRAADEAKHLKAELQRIDRRLARAADERDGASAALSAVGLSPAARAEHGRRLKALDDEVRALEARWIEVSEALEQMAGTAQAAST
jgi:ATP-binding cassette subfamily F protein 3